MTKQFAGAIGQVSNQVNMVIMGLAGTHRILALLDEKEETDEGYVTLVNAHENADGSLTECAERTNVWAWKHPHHDGTVTYTRLQGDVRFFDVDFGYTPEKTVLHDVSLYAKPGQKVAFVGSTGAGKTTITNLINRFYDIEDGKIRYDGININKIRKADLRRSLGIVLNASRQPSWQARTISSRACRRATRRRFQATAPTFRRVSASCLPLRAPPWQTRL